MATFPFTPSLTSNFTFQPTLDGVVYNCLVYWNIFGQRWYIHCTDLNGVLQFDCAVVGSPQASPGSTTPGYDISLCAPAGFTSTLVYREGANQFEVNP